MKREAGHIVVLTGHGIGIPPGCIGDVDSEMWITEEQFERTLELLTPKTCLTFDDGFGCCWDIAFPAMQRRGMIAKFFVTVGNLGKHGYLTEDQVCEMSRAGMLIGTHGMHHRPWRKLNENAMHEEIFEARERLEAVLEGPVTEAACPFGAYDRRTLDALRNSGIQTVYTSDRALPKSNFWIVPRYTIRRSDSLQYIEEVVSERHDATIVGRAKMLLKRWR